MSALLASVYSPDEARIALGAYADIIDCKNPHQGALGALPANTISDIVRTVDNERPTSATIGDDIRTARKLSDAVQITADCGVDYVKFGLFTSHAVRTYTPLLRTLASRHDLIAVCFVDRYDPSGVLKELADSGVRGVMIDTADKAGGSLTELWPAERISTFVRDAQQLDLLCGLAGRLQLGDIMDLLPLQADYLGFRSALCDGDRRSGLDHAAVMQVRQAIPFPHNTQAITQSGVALH